MKAKLWVAGYLLIVVSLLGIAGKWVYDVDPFFHYHKPNTEAYYYTLNNERSQNDGICKHFDYNALITGTSMTENFKTSEMDALFGTKTVKVCYSGASYKEINDGLQVALEHNPDLKTIVRGLDMGKFFDASDNLRVDLGVYPTYLYDENPLNDVEYLFNKSVIFDRVYPMTQANDEDGFEPGMTSFDEYSNWQASKVFGVNAICPEGVTKVIPGGERHLTAEEKSVIQENIDKNVILLAQSYPDVTFYYFFTPYSIIWWKNLVETGRIYRQLEAEEYIIELILECDNIHLYSFNGRTDITTDLNNYKDDSHYGEWINSLILKWIYDGKYRLTKDNYKEYLKKEISFYTSFDYESLNTQADYESDFYAAALCNQELNDVDPINLLEDEERLELSPNSFLVTEQYNGMKGVLCVGNLKRESESTETVADYLMNSEYIGAKIAVKDVDKYKYLVFYGKKNVNMGQPSVYVYNSQNEREVELTKQYTDLDDEWHQYVMDISEVKGDISIVFNGGYINSEGEEFSSYTFSGIYLY